MEKMFVEYPGRATEEKRGRLSREASLKESADKAATVKDSAP